MNTNQIGRELTRRLVEAQKCDIQSAVRFYYNSDTYTNVGNMDDVDALYQKLEQEYVKG